jgi:outer membrane protein assembly factor BamB
VALCCAALLAQQRAVFRPGHEPPAVSLWHVKGEGWGRPAADETSAYFLSKDHRLLAFDAATGALRWQKVTGATGLTTSGSMVFVAGDSVVTGDYDVVAFDRSTGALRWRFVPTEGYGPGSYLGVVADGLVYTGSPAGRVYGIDAVTGRSRWTAVVADDRRTVVFEPTADRELVVAGYGVSTVPNTGGVVALEAKTGRERWRTAFPRPSNPALGSNSAGNPILVDDLVIASTGYGAIYGFDREDGSIRWSIPTLGGLPSDTLSSPEFDFRPLARTGRTLLAGSLTGYLVAYSLDTLREIWRRAGPRHISIAFNISSDERSVYVPYLGGSLIALNVLTGSERWRTSTASGAFSFPLLPAGNRLFVASSSSGFYALKP